MPPILIRYMFEFTLKKLALRVEKPELNWNALQLGDQQGPILAIAKIVFGLG
jgi:hypothetical protein